MYLPVEFFVMTPLCSGHRYSIYKYTYVYTLHYRLYYYLDLDTYVGSVGYTTVCIIIKINMYPVTKL